MSILALLAIFWWSVCGFLAVVVGIWAFVSVLGIKGRIILSLLVSTVGGHLLGNYFDAEEKTANRFVNAWSDESHDFPKGRINSHTVGEYLDYDRGKEVSPYLALWFRLRWHADLTKVGKDTITPQRSATPIKTKVFTTHVGMHDSGSEANYEAMLKIWVASDNAQVVDFMFEDIVFK
jgi:hypothetical protein